MKRITLFVTALLTLNTLSAQTYCDTINRMIYLTFEHPPKPNLTESELEIRLNSALDSTLLRSYKADFFIVTFYVNCNGEGFNYKLATRVGDRFQYDTISNFQKVFLSLMQSSLSWSPGIIIYNYRGKQYEKAVDCPGSYSIRVDGNKLHILNEKENKKHLKQGSKK